MTKYAGTKINFGGQDIIVPPLSLGQAQSFDGVIHDYNQRVAEASKSHYVPYSMLAEWVPIFGAAVRRNYPEITDQEILETIDLSAFSTLQGAVLGHRKGEDLTRGE